MKYWLMKSEPDVFGIDDLERAPRHTTGWEGVRNYQARNMLRDDFGVGDRAFFYHSSCAVPGVAGIVQVVRAAYADPTQFDREERVLRCREHARGTALVRRRRAVRKSF